MITSNTILTKYVIVCEVIRLKGQMQCTVLKKKKKLQKQNIRRHSNSTRWAARLFDNFSGYYKNERKNTNNNNTEAIQILHCC